jgi:nitrite reductase/ring-hydroxylating ferredoxin subunit
MVNQALGVRRLQAGRRLSDDVHGPHGIQGAAGQHASQAGPLDQLHHQIGLRHAGRGPVVAVRTGGAVHVMADRCSHMSGPLSDGELADGCLTCPWHGSVFRITDGSVARGPATAPQPAFQVREADGAIQVCLPGAG